MAEENPSWGYARIQRALKHVDHRVARSTTANFFTTEVWTARRLVTQCTLVIIDIATRRVQVAGTTSHPISTWMEQIARNLTDWEDGFLREKRFLIIDRDCIFSTGFKAILTNSGIEVLLTAYQAPNMNAYVERFVRSITSECLDQMILVGQRSLDRALKEYVEYYHEERTHQGIGNRLVSGAEPQRCGRVAASRRLGRMLSYYHRRAA